ncbi:MAG: hypothetical protein E7324_08130 [Clostridiales bacterium]|nr:hypothetical protein [Clostridiales bacterium]
MKKRNGVSLRMGGLVLAGLCFCFAIMVSDAKAPEEMLPVPEADAWEMAQKAAAGGDRLAADCQITQTMCFSRCGHSVTRRIAPPVEMQGAAFEEAVQYYDAWQIEAFSESGMEMQREISLFCPMHYVLTANEAGDVVLSRNYYGDGMQVLEHCGKQISEYAEEEQLQLLLGLGFDSREQALSWLSLH